ncbi:TerB family tellurite resistance protein [Shewanella corallii]|uniref:TerB family tellurite resistance protein n=1 Tax=Shewanella corallii TaxID=560080 RepID=A0ABT0NBS3_9GAMM|nr:TerB family tellurite resistance protein [Shewanella corallii]MCL2915560.1 TerB family tellurite resistance protein [Shewanella corallii]
MISYLLSFRGQIGRLEFLAHFILVLLLLVSASAVAKESGLSEEQMSVLMVPVSIAAMYLFLSAATRRCRDLGIHLAWLLVLLIPFANYGMLVMFVFVAGWASKSGISSLLTIQKFLAESDGAVNSKETIAFEDIWKAEMGDKFFAIAVEQFVHGKLNPLISYKSQVNSLKKKYGKNPEQIYAAMSMLVMIAQADARINEKEASLLEHFAEKLGANTLIPPGFAIVMGMLAKMAKADGVVVSEEISVIDSFLVDGMQFNSEQRKMAIDEFNKAKDSKNSFSDYLLDFSRTHEGRRDLFELTFSVLLDVALADGSISLEEEKMLDEAAKVLQINFDKKESPGAGGIDPVSQEAIYERILGLHSGYTINDVKRRYKELIAKNHPDKVVGLSDAIREAAEMESKKINEAYEFFKRKLNGGS